MNLISFFSGAGGLDFGFEKAGFTTIFSNEFDKTIYPTHQKNFPKTELSTSSILNLKTENIPECLGMIGGPPCQSFSQAGAKRGFDEPRGQLFWEYIRILKAKKPLFFVAENVSGLLAPRHQEALQKILSSFEETGYNTTYHLYNASDYEVPQDRKRLIIVGYLKTTNKFFTPPKPISSDTSLKKAIGDLPESSATEYGNKNTNLTFPNHEHMLGTFSSMYMSRNRVRNWNQPSFTILASARQIPIHPSSKPMIKKDKDVFVFQDENHRRLSIRECARIQTFPDCFTFEYNRIENGYKMIGNAVPVNLAKHIAQKIKSDLKL